MNHASQCPTVEQLRADNELSTASKPTDPWDMPYQIRCVNEGVYVVSYGPDKKEGTNDDIRTPDDTPTGTKSFANAEANP